MVDFKKLQTKTKGAEMNDDNLIRMGLILLAMAVLCAHITNMLQDKQNERIEGTNR